MATDADSTASTRAIPDGRFFCLICLRVIEEKDVLACVHLCERCNQQLREGVASLPPGGTGRGAG